VTNSYQYLIFDLDDTLYSHRTGLMEEIGRRILLYMTGRMGFSPQESVELRKRFNVQYGTVLCGLQNEYHIDPADYLHFVHDVPLRNYLALDPSLDAMLSRIPLSKAVFTNADTTHAQRVLDCLGIAHHFPVIVDIYAVEFYCKPRPEAYRRMLDLIGVEGRNCIMVEDSARNLHPASELFGITAVIVDGIKSDGVDYAISDLLELESLLHRISNL
jgi:putative hydrolase of the HAD superfamily